MKLQNPAAADRADGTVFYVEQEARKRIRKFSCDSRDVIYECGISLCFLAAHSEQYR
jgi:hypothetical protein